MYWCEMWSKTKGDETKLFTLERKVRRIYDPNDPNYNAKLGKYERGTIGDIKKL